MASEIKVDTISEKTSANGVTIDGLKIKDVTSSSVMSKPVLQVVTGTSSTDTSVASTSYTDTTLSASITPSSTSSKILILVSQTASVSRDSGTAIGYLNIMRDSSQIWEGYVAVTASRLGQTSVMYLDSPSTTSATTYKTQGKVDTTANNGQIRFQQDSSLSDRNSSIHLIEIGA